MLRAYMEAAPIFQIEKALRFGTVQVSSETVSTESASNLASNE